MYKTAAASQETAYSVTAEARSYIKELYNLIIGYIHYDLIILLLLLLD
jgi:hypothetical protein